MTSGADLFVVCKQCGSEVSPYITECPYCGGRLRRRAPKLPRVRDAGGGPGRRAGLTGLLRRSAPRTRPRPVRTGYSDYAAARPNATIALVLVSCGAWISIHAEPQIYERLAIIGPLHGDWWRLFTSELVYLRGSYALVAIVTLALFGWLVEQRHGPAVVLAVFFGVGAAAALAACAVENVPFVAGANGAALALLAIWAVPDLRSLRAGEDYEGDLLGAGAFAALLLAVPFAFARVAVLATGRGAEVSFTVTGSEANWLVGVVGAVIGLLIGLGLCLRAEAER